MTSVGMTGDVDVKREPVEEPSATSGKEDSETSDLTGYQRILSIMATKQVRSYCDMFNLHLQEMFSVVFVTW